jgi:hypothetical protein
MRALLPHVQNEPTHINKHSQIFIMTPVLLLHSLLHSVLYWLMRLNQKSALAVAVFGFCLTLQALGLRRPLSICKKKIERCRGL